MVDLMDPLTVFGAAVAAINREDWRAAASLVDPISVRAFQKQIIEPRPTRLSGELPGVSSVEAAMALSPEEVFAIWLEAKSVRRKVQAWVAEKRLSAESAEALLASGILRWDYVAVGVVFDGDR